VTVAVAPAAMLPKGQLSWFPPVIVHEALLGTGVISPVEVTLSTTQVVKLPGVGSGSVNTTFDAVPGPVLVTVTVKKILSPTLNEFPSGIFRIVMPGTGAKVTCSHWHKIGAVPLRTNSVDTKLVPFQRI